MEHDFRETLYTVDAKGRRKWVYTSLVKGKFLTLRQIVAYSLLIFYLAMPWVTIGGKQGIFLNFFDGRFIFFGVEFWATDTLFLFLTLCSLAFALFFFTACFGRIWCGWACPETVFLEFLFRPIEHLIEGNATQRKRLDEQPWDFEKIRKKLLKHSICAILSWVIASTFLAYFIGREPLLAMMTNWPHKNPIPFTLTLVFMGIMAFQFGWFREQFCTVLCPYARFQSVLMDSNSIVVGYDVIRGEPRGKLKNSETTEENGDCVACNLCVRVCPTGIDIRNGLQMECIACTACIDACDSIMAKVGRPLGLIRYDTENRLLGKTTVSKYLRPRPVVYGVILLAFLGTLSFLLTTRELAEFQILRGALDNPYSLLNKEQVSNHFHVRVSNKSDSSESYTFASSENPDLEIITPLSPFTISGGEIKTVPLFINFPNKTLQKGTRKVTISIKGNSGFKSSQEVTLLGPDE